MGCDIHQYFETWNGKSWELTWPIVPNKDYWWESIIDQDQDPLQVAMAVEKMGVSTLEEAQEKYADECKYYDEFDKLVLKLYYSQMNMADVETRFLHHPDCYREQLQPELNPDREFDFIYPEVGSRNYAFFGMLANVRWEPESGPAMGDPRGLPQDTHQLIRLDSDKWDCDGHSHSYWMVQEILDSPCWDYPEYNMHGSFKDSEQRKWLETFVEDPINTRMVFWFDN